MTTVGRRTHTFTSGRQINCGMLMRCRFNNCFLIPRASATEKCNYTKPTAGHTDHSSIRQRQWRRHGGRGESFPPCGWTSKNYVMCVCAFIVMELLRITRQMHCKAVEQRATLIHRQYGDWGTSYSRPPIDPYLTSPPVTKSWRRHWSTYDKTTYARSPYVNRTQLQHYAYAP